jgi:LmbE family N-acetylglucosaminyl deacetylase
MIGHLKHSGRPRLLAVFAHPDDESFLAGGTLAKYARLDWDIFLACATDGEAGQRGEYGAIGVNEFADVRRSELKAACHALGIQPPMFLECADRAVASICWNSAAKQIAKIMRRLRPNIVITFGPDGVSGHPDHVALSQIVSSAFWAATVHTFPWQEKLSSSRRASLYSRRASLYYVLRSASVPQGCQPSVTIEPPRLTTVIDIASVGQQKLAAIHSHRSQEHLQPANESSVQLILSAPEQFHRAYPKWDETSPETELFHPSSQAQESPTNSIPVLR